MALIEERYGKERAQTDGRFKKEREAWATAIYGLALSKWYGGRQYWIEIETVDDTPDNRLHYLDATADGNMLETIPVEVVDWEQHVDDPIKVIKKKCARPYPSNYRLVVNARHTGKLLDFDRITAEMQTMPSPFAEVWIVGRFVDGLKAVRVAHGSLAIDLTYADCESARKQKAFLELGTRGSSTKMEDIGPVFLFTP